MEARCNLIYRTERFAFGAAGRDQVRVIAIGAEDDSASTPLVGAEPGAEVVAAFLAAIRERLS